MTVSLSPADMFGNKNSCPQSSRILIIGAGIAGLTAALALHARGFAHVSVLERAPSHLTGGSGLNLMPLAVRELDRLDLLDDLVEQSVQLVRLTYTTHQGAAIWTELKGVAGGFAWPQLSISRARLHKILVDAVLTRMGADAIINNANVMDIRDLPDGRVEVICRDAQVFVGMLVVGADGIRSTVRNLIAPEFTGLQLAPVTIYRGYCRETSFADGKTMFIAGNGRSKFVVYPMLNDPAGDTLVNWAAAIPDTDRSLPLGKWNCEVEPESIAASFEGWSIGDVQPADMIRATGHVFAYPMVDIDPLLAWSNGTTQVLIGDAAHAMYPIGSNGATQSIVDAISLAHFLETNASVGEALMAFENDRGDTVRSLQLANRKQGPEVVIDLVAARAPAGFEKLEEVFAPGELEEIARRYAVAAGVQVQKVNAESPYGRPSIKAVQSTQL